MKDSRRLELENEALKKENKGLKQKLHAKAEAGDKPEPEKKTRAKAK